jgi:hypothetical protein
MKKIYLGLLFTAIILSMIGCQDTDVSTGASSDKIYTADTNSGFYNQNVTVHKNTEITFARVKIDSEVTRLGGPGNCGIEPWSKGCTTSRDWWGMQLDVDMTEYVALIPDGVDRWVITNQEDVIKDYYPNADLSQPVANYSKNALTYTTNGCSLSISGSTQRLLVMGERTNENITLILSPQATERIVGNCSGAPVNQTGLTIWQWATAAVLSGNPLDMTATISESEVTDGGYIHRFSGTTNPSPDNRDTVEDGAVILECISKTDSGTWQPALCPWQQ